MLRSDYTDAQADLGLYCPLTDSVDTVLYVDGIESTQTDAHADLGLCCSNMVLEPLFQAVHHIGRAMRKLVLVKLYFDCFKYNIIYNNTIF